jgi:acyl-CoA thioester hydrolase
MASNPLIPQHEINCRVYWEDTDAGGVVYYANYLKFMERCRTEWLRNLGIDQRRLREQRGLQFAIVSLSVDYSRPARLDDWLRVTAVLERMGGASFSFSQEIYRDEMLLVSAHTRVACLDSLELTPRPIPKDLFTEWRNE